MALAAVVVLGAVVAWRLLAPGSPERTAAAVAAADPAPAQPGATTPRRSAPRPGQAIDELPNSDPNDLANYFRPGDPEPTGAELIGALHDVGIRTGIGAFNPPGTSPPLEGLAVPEDYELPEGYVRHHQSTDDGVAIEPILMFAPDFRLYDANGRPIAMPDSRVVPPELAPPGLPPRRVRIPPSGP
ncbi:MAG: hypothetical protein DCF27_06800 [Lysobacteraceae bacterium]|nr:MAG: hypothetical protein DCF27_06800 [Xanthomonadaceae bacterium]